MLRDLQDEDEDEDETHAYQSTGRKRVKLSHAINCSVGHLSN